MAPNPVEGSADRNSSEWCLMMARNSSKADTRSCTEWGSSPGTVIVMPPVSSLPTTDGPRRNTADAWDVEEDPPLPPPPPPGPAGVELVLGVDVGVLGADAESPEDAPDGDSSSAAMTTSSSFKEATTLLSARGSVEGDREMVKASVSTTPTCCASGRILRLRLNSSCFR
jgi:hypothetical protein